MVKKEPLTGGNSIRAKPNEWVAEFMKEFNHILAAIYFLKIYIFSLALV